MMHETDGRPVRSANVLELLGVWGAAAPRPARVVVSCASRGRGGLGPLWDVKHLSTDAIDTKGAPMTYLTEAAALKRLHCGRDLWLDHTAITEGRARRGTDPQDS